jgi:hypothetical protein
MSKKREAKVIDKKKEKPNKLIIVGGFILFGYILYGVCNTFVQYIELKWYGKNSKAVVTKFIKYEGTNPAINYEYEIDGIKYTEKAVRISDEKKVGDTISIIYLPDNPKINRIEE